ncbi:serine/threonine protein kinase [Micromonospora peucetia]|uniref:serine/threonine protein kinase n=1 Tax=Micromonospora peucetia TaxID=47871 RepID=UPI0022592CA5|nr:serine/threonine protein kinase [Micromonospora peucetia]MCX4386646.1 serine/threonine protein kinase [Micromonospora peucetia]
MNDIIPTLPELGLDFLPLEPDDPAAVGDIRLLGRIGEGGMGRVYLGMTQADRAVAVKVVKDPYSTDPSFRARFAREAAIASRVGGVFTAPVVSHDAEAVRPWLATAFVPGLNLAVAVARHGTLPLHGVWRLAAGVAEALKAIHAAGIVHRDLKPGNVLLAADGPRVIDFGISRADGERDLTQTGVRMGTPSYMAPEQVRGEKSTPATDVFALGSVVAFAATGRAPFRAGNAVELVYRVTQGEPDLDGITDPGLRELVSRCLAKDPQLRPTPQDVIAAYVDRSAAATGQGWLPDGLEETLPQIGAALTVPARAPGIAPTLAVTKPIGQDGLADGAPGPDTVAEPVAAVLTKLPDLTTHALPPIDTRRRSWRRPAVAAAVGVLVVVLGGTYLASGGVGSGAPSAGGPPTDLAAAAPAAPIAGGPSGPASSPHAPGATSATGATGPTGATNAPGAPGGGPGVVTSPSVGRTPTKDDPGVPAPTRTAPRASGLPSGPFNPDNMVIVSSDGTVLSTTDTKHGSKVVTAAWGDLPGQRWKFESDGEVMVVRSLPSMQFTINYDERGILKPTSFGNLYGWVYDSGKRQFRKRNASGCLTSRGSGQPVGYGVCDGSENQRWRIVS